MQLVYTPNACLEFQFTVEPHSPTHKAAIDAMRNWSDIRRLVEFAESRHSYCNTDGFFGIQYPDDLDEYDRANGCLIQDGYIEAIAWYGAHHGETHTLPESEYLELLRQFLVLNEYPKLADRVEKLIGS